MVEGARVRPKPSGKKLMTHPTLGRVSVVYSKLQANDNPDLRLLLYGAMTSEKQR